MYARQNGNFASDSQSQYGQSALKQLGQQQHHPLPNSTSQIRSNFPDQSGSINDIEYSNKRSSVNQQSYMSNPADSVSNTVASIAGRSSNIATGNRFSSLPQQAGAQAFADAKNVSSVSSGSTNTFELMQSLANVIQSRNINITSGSLKSSEPYNPTSVGYQGYSTDNSNPPHQSGGIQTAGRSQYVANYQSQSQQQHQLPPQQQHSNQGAPYQPDVMTHGKSSDYYNDEPPFHSQHAAGSSAPSSGVPRQGSHSMEAAHSEGSYTTHRPAPQAGGTTQNYWSNPQYAAPVAASRASSQNEYKPATSAMTSPHLEDPLHLKSNEYSQRHHEQKPLGMEGPTLHYQQQQFKDAAVVGSQYSSTFTRSGQSSTMYGEATASANIMARGANEHYNSSSTGPVGHHNGPQFPGPTSSAQSHGGYVPPAVGVVGSATYELDRQNRMPMHQQGAPDSSHITPKSRFQEPVDTPALNSLLPYNQRIQQTGRVLNSTTPMDGFGGTSHSNTATSRNEYFSSNQLNTTSDIGGTASSVPFVPGDVRYRPSGQSAPSAATTGSLQSVYSSGL